VPGAGSERLESAPLAEVLNAPEHYEITSHPVPSADFSILERFVGASVSADGP